MDTGRATPTEDGRRGSFTGGKMLIAVIVVALSARLFTHIQTAPPNVCGSPGGPPVTANRIQLRDGRFLAYHESGVYKHVAKYKIVLAHAFMSSRLSPLGASQELMEELGVYVVGYDRPGYGESDPDPRRSLKSTSLDVEELADQLELGSKFYLVTISIGGHVGWGCLKYIPTRLAGVALIGPTVNYRWPGLPKNLSSEAYYKQPIGDQWTLRIAYYAPWLLNWFLTQQWFPSSTVIKGTPVFPNRDDQILWEKIKFSDVFRKMMDLATQQGVHESLHRDMMVMFGKWDFDPTELQPVPGSVHLWQGDEDGLVPVTLNRYICQQLPWIHYHELNRMGHLFVLLPQVMDLTIQTLLGFNNTGHA